MEGKPPISECDVVSVTGKYERHKEEITDGINQIDNNAGSEDRSHRPNSLRVPPDKVKEQEIQQDSSSTQEIGNNSVSD